MHQPLLYQRRLVTLLRWVMFLALAYLIGASGEASISLRVGLLAVVAASNIALWRLPAGVWEHPALLPIVAGIDIAVLLASMLSEPGFSRDFFFAYFVLLAFAAMAANLRWAIAGTALVVVAYGTLLVLENGGNLFQTPALIGRIGFLFTMGVGYGGLMEATRARLRESALQGQLVGWAGKLRAAFSEDFDVNDVIRQVLVDVQNVYPGNVRASLVQLREDSIKVISSSDDEEVVEQTLDIERYPELMTVIERGEPVVIDDIRTSPLTESVRDLVKDVPFKALLLCPVNLDAEFGHVILRVGRNSGGFTPGIVKTTHSVAEAIAVVFRQAKMREAVEKSERMEMVSQITNSVAHSFDSLLSTVLLAAGHLRKDVTSHATRAACAQTPCDEESMGRFETIELAVKEGMTIVERLAAWTRLDDSVDASSQRVRLDPQKVLEEAWRYVQPHWARREATRTLELLMQAEETPAIEGNAHELREVLLNLFLNAIDAMPKGGTLTLGLCAESDWVVFSVEDTGVGMSERQRERIFEPLYSTKGTAGTGLGLTIARAAAARHGGAVTVESREGVGSRFCLVLPAANALAEDADEPGAASVAPASSRVLLVEPNELVRDVMLRVLQSNGLDVDVVGTCDEAEVMLDTQRGYDGLVADVVSTPEDPGVFLESLRTTRPDLDGRVLFYFNGRLPQRFRELQEPYGFSCVDRSAGLAALQEAISRLTGVENAA